MSKAKDLWYWMCDHKKQILLTVGCVALGVAAEEIRWNHKTKNMIEVLTTPESNTLTDLAKPEAMVGVITDYWKEGLYPTAILNDLDVSDLGAAGGQFIGSNGITEKTKADAVITFFKN